MNEEYDVNVTVDEDVTDLVPVESDDSEGGIGAGEVALGALALVGAGFLVKKGYDGVKWVYGKAKSGIQNLKDKKAEKKAAKEAEASSEEDQPVEGEVLEGEVTETK